MNLSSAINESEPWLSHFTKCRSFLSPKVSKKEAMSMLVNLRVPYTALDT